MFLCLFLIQNKEKMQNFFLYFLQNKNYCIYLAIRRGFPSLEWVQIIKSVLCNVAVIRVLPFLNNPKDLDPSYKTDLDFWDCFGRKKTPVLLAKKYGK